MTGTHDPASTDLGRGTLLRAFTLVLCAVSAVALAAPPATPLPPEKVYSIHVSDSYKVPPGMKPNTPYQTGGGERIPIDPPYLPCVELELPKLGGNSALTRNIAYDSQGKFFGNLTYMWSFTSDLAGDGVATIDGDLKVLTVLDPAKDKRCQSFREYSLVIATGSTYHTLNQVGYVENNNEGVHKWYEIRVLELQPGYYYCSLRMCLTTRVNKGRTGWFLQDTSTATDVRVMLQADPHGSEGTSIGAKLSVRFVPEPAHDHSCTAPVGKGTMHQWDASPDNPDCFVLK